MKDIGYGNEFMKYGFNEFVDRKDDEVKYQLTDKGEEYLTWLDMTLNELQSELDPVNNPKHYTFGKYEVLDVIEDWELGFHLGNVVKYVARSKHKGNEVQDLEKARFYLDRFIELVRGKENEKYCEEID